MARPLLWGRILLGATVVATLAVLVGTARRLSNVEVPASLELPADAAPAAGNEAPDFRLPTLDGDEVSLSSLRGQVVLVDFWATWCGPCRPAMRLLQRLYEEFGGRGVTVVGINLDAHAEEVAPYVHREGLTYPILLGGQAAQASYGVSALPTLFVVDQSGAIRHVHVGHGPGAASVLADEIEALLAGG